MLRNARFFPLIVLAGALTWCGSAQAHNLFVLVQPQASGPDLVDVIFEHFPYPGQGTYNKPHLDRGKTWVQLLGSKDQQALKLTEKTRLGKKFLQSKTDVKGPRSIVHTCKWGVYKGRLDYFHGKYLDVTSRGEMAKCARTAELPLDLVPSFTSDGKLTITVLYESKPLAKKRVSIWPPGGKETKLVTDDKGAIVIAKSKKGTWSFSALHTLEGPTGKFDGESYKGIMHGTTVSLKLPLK